MADRPNSRGETTKIAHRMSTPTPGAKQRSTKQPKVTPPPEAKHNEPLANGEAGLTPKTMRHSTHVELAENQKMGLVKHSNTKGLPLQTRRNATTGSHLSYFNLEEANNKFGYEKETPQVNRIRLWKELKLTRRKNVNISHVQLHHVPNVVKKSKTQSVKVSTNPTNKLPSTTLTISEVTSDMQAGQVPKHGSTKLPLKTHPEPQNATPVLPQPQSHFRPIRTAAAENKCHQPSAEQCTRKSAAAAKSDPSANGRTSRRTDPSGLIQLREAEIQTIRIRPIQIRVSRSWTIRSESLRYI